MKKALFLLIALAFLVASSGLAQNQQRTKTIGMERYRSIIENYVPSKATLNGTRNGGTVVFSENFDNTGGQLPAGWTSGGSGTNCQWHVDASPNPPGFYSASYSLNYNNGVDFNCGDNWGYVRTPLIPVAGNDFDITFWYNINNECSNGNCAYDQNWITVYDASMNVLFAALVPGNTTWQQNLFTFTNDTQVQQVYIEFYFDTYDGLFNNYYGPFIDDLEVVGHNAVPVSGWALAIGIGLIAVFTFFRIRRTS